MVSQNWSDRAPHEIANLARSAMELDGDNPEVLHQAGYLIALSGGDTTGGISFVAKSIELNPNNAVALQTIGSMYAYAGDRQNAIECLERSIRLNPFDRSLDYYLGHALAHFVAGEYEATIKWTGEMLRQVPNHAASHRYQAASLGLLGRVEEGRKVVQRLLELVPDFTIARARRYIEIDLKTSSRRRALLMRSTRVSGGLACQSNLAQLCLICRQYVPAETCKDDLFDRRFICQEPGHRTDCDTRCIPHRIAVDAATDRGKGNRAYAVRRRKRQALGVAARQQLGLAVPAVAIARPDCMDHELRRQPIPSGDLRLTGRTATQRAAFRQQFRPRGAMDRTVHTATAQQRLVRRIHDRIHGKLRDVRLHDDYALHGALRHSQSRSLNQISGTSAEIAISASPYG
jgi:tetratricopeptide (TPR) repeat protein